MYPVRFTAKFFMPNTVFVEPDVTGGGSTSTSEEEGTA